ncbi:MAG: HNH endonuclease signature motif containing protein [Streptosporangiaceae bacterium]
MPRDGAHLPRVRADIHRRQAPLPGVQALTADLRDVRTGTRQCQHAVHGMLAQIAAPASAGRLYPAGGQYPPRPQARRPGIGAGLTGVYEAIARSGPCVYCGEHAGTVDHVRPLTRGGDEHLSNLVPCCAPCNFSKGPRLLTEWEPPRVAYAAGRSPLVATELARLLADAHSAPLASTHEYPFTRDRQDTSSG